MDTGMVWRELLGLVQPVVLGLVGWGLNTLRKWVATRNNNELLDALLGRMNDAVLDAVKTVFQIFVDPLKKQGAVLTVSQRAAAKSKAIEIAKMNIGSAMIEKIKKANGYSDSQLDDVLGALVEKVLYDSGRVLKQPKADTPSSRKKSG